VHLSIVTPAKTVVDSDVDSVVLPGSEGEFGVLNLHERFLAPLQGGVVEYRVDGRAERLSITGGFAEVGPDHVVILADAAEATE
jgi:F-type H+-transporting ATPase subunit epsilon